jgi:hypothetical protein
MKKVFVIAVGVVVAASLALLGGTAHAANGDQYCFGGTTYVTPFVAPNGFDVSDASMLYYLSQGTYAWINMQPPPGQTVYSATSDPTLRPSPPFQQITVAAGACPAGTTWVAPEARVAVCSPTPLKRGDGTEGSFIDMNIKQYADPSSPYHTMPFAAYASGGSEHGLTCDNLAGLGYKDSGTFVDSAGTADPNSDVNAAAGAGHNNIYRLWVSS